MLGVFYRRAIMKMYRITLSLTRHVVVRQHFGIGKSALQEHEAEGRKRKVRPATRTFHTEIVRN